MRKLIGLSLLLLTLSACALFPNRDPVNINVVGIEPLQSQDLEVRFAVKLRIQNPNETSIDYSGVALDLEVNGRPLASGVSDDVNRQGELLADPVSIGQRAAQRAASRLGARPVPTCEVPVLFSAELAGGLFGSFLGAISGGNLYRKSSFLEGAIGQKLFPEWLTIDERPHLMRAMGSTSFDGDGLATYAKPFVEKGELVSYVLGTYAGRKLGLPSTANSGGVHNLFVTHGDEDQAALLRRMGRGLLVTELMGHGLNRVTGDYARGAEGFWVENGEIQFADQEVTIAGNMRDMFKQIVAVGNDLELRSNIRTGSALIERMTVAGS